MRNPFRVGGFERRLVVFFLLLSVLPTLLIAFFSTRYFMRSVELVSNPAVEQSFTNSMEIARDFAAKLEEDARCTVVRLADEYARAGRPQAGKGLETILRKVSAETRADFTALYTLEGRSWKIKMSYPEAFARIEPEIRLDAATATPGSLDPVQVAFPDQDVIASAVVKDSALFVAGFALGKGFTEKMRRTGADLGRYHAVGLYVSVLRRYIIIVTSVLVVILAVSSALVSRLLARRISQPITELARATERVARGDLEHRVTVTARDEVQSLVTGFNKMTEELQENKQNLIRAERIAAWRDVARRIAHEIKNPLTPIEIAIYRIKKRIEADSPEALVIKDREVIQESLDSILKEVTALKAIAQEFSSFAKLPEPKFEPLDINDVIKSVLELYASSSQNIQVRSNLLSSDLPRVRADKDQMRSVVANLVKNAFEAMPEGGTLTITTLQAPVGKSLQPGARIEISDTGAGIPQEIREKIFDPYFTTKSTGTGIGLALAFRIVSDHQGRISFTTGETGTTFTVDLPAASAKAG
ncbi:MAG: ATP-binding protein [Candidatus Eisenbacteria bacterium]